MFPYVFLVALCLVGSVFYKKKYDTLSSDFIFLILLFLSCFRGGGFGLGDYDNYREFYDLLGSWADVLNHNFPAEIGFRFFSFLGHYLGYNSQFIIIVMGVFSLVPVYYLIRKYSEYKVLSLFFFLPYFLTFNMHTSRTAVAAAFGLLFIYYLYNKKYLFSSVWFLAAVSFHKSAVVLVFLVLTLFKIEIIFLLLFLSFLCVVLVSPLDVVIPLLNKTGFRLLAHKIVSYRGGEYGYAMSLYDPRIIISLIISFFGFNIRKELSSIETYYLKVFLLGVMLMVLFSDVVIMAWRSSYLFMIVGVIVVPAIAKVYNVRIYKGTGIKASLSIFVLTTYGLYLSWLIYRANPFVLYHG